MAKLVQRARYEPTKGIDLKAGDRTRTADYLTGGSNAQYNENNLLTKRFGFQKIAYSTSVRGGIYPFSTTDYKGVSKSEVVGFGRFPYRLVKAYFTVTNSLASEITMSMYYVSSDFYFKVLNSAGGTLLNYALSGKYVSDLVTQIDGLASIAASTPSSWSTGATTTAAEYSEIMDDEKLAAGSSRNIYFYYWEIIPSPQYGAVCYLNSGSVDTTNDTFTYAGHGLVDGDAVQMNGILGSVYGANVPAPLADGTVYYVVSATTDTFKVSATLGGAAINLTTTGKAWTVKLAGGQPIYHGMSDSEWRLPSASLIGGRLYFTTSNISGSQSSLTGNASDDSISGWDNPTIGTNPFTRSQRHICKYDGQAVSRIHVPKPSLNLYLDGGTYDVRGTKAWGVSGETGDRSYKATFLAIDKTGNVTESDAINLDFISIGGANPPTFYAAIDASWRENHAIAGFNDHHARVNGTQTGVTQITVDTGHTFIVGDVAYFWNEDKSLFISREVTAVGATTVTISTTPIMADDQGGTVKVLDNAVMSPNTRCALWRTSGGETGDYYLVYELPFVFGATSLPEGTILYLDARQDTYLGARLKERETAAYWPPMGTLLSSYNNQLIVSGVGDSKSSVFFSEGTDIEAFPLATNSFDIDSDVSAFGQSGPGLAVFSNYKTNVAYGDLASFNFRVDKLSENIGCTAHHSIQEVDEGVIFYQTHKGPYMLVNGRSLSPVGESKGTRSSVLEPYFTDNYSHVSSVGASQNFPQFSHSIASSISRQNQYVLHVPWASDSKPNYGSADSDTFCYDYRNGSWSPVWTGLEFNGGMCVLDNDMFGLSIDSSTGATTLWKQVNNKGDHNYADHSTAISASVQTHWDSLGYPDLYKKYLWLTVSGGECDSSSWGLRCKTYVNYDPNTTHSDFTFSFTSNGPPQEQKLKSGKFNSMMFDFSNTTRYENFVLSGWMWEVALPIAGQSSSWGNQNR